MNVVLCDRWRPVEGLPYEVSDQTGAALQFGATGQLLTFLGATWGVPSS
jgi:hypothetical protein